MRREGDALRSLQRFVAGVLAEPWDIRLTVEAGVEPERPFALVEQNGTAVTEGRRNVQDVTVAYTVSIYLPEAPTRQAANDAAMGVREQMWQAVKWGPDLHHPTPDRIPLFDYEARIAVQRVRVRGATSGTWRLGADGQWTAPIAFDAFAPAVRSALGALLDTPASGSDPGMANVMVVPRGVGVFDVMFVGDLAGLDVAPLELDVGALVEPVSPGVTVVLNGAPAPWRSPSDFLRVVDFAQTTIVDPDSPTLVMVAVDLRCTFARTLPLPFDHMKLQRVSATDGSGG